MAEQIEQDATIAARGGGTTVGIVPWTTPVHVFPGHAFDIYDEDAVVVAAETATATPTGATDVATYVELFEELEKLACFGDEAVEHLERIAGEYREPAKSLGGGGWFSALPEEDALRLACDWIPLANEGRVYAEHYTKFMIRHDDLAAARWDKALSVTVFDAP